MQVRGKIIKRNTRCWRLAEQILISWRKQQHHCFRKRYMKEKKKAKFVVNENHSLRGTHDGQKYFNGPNQKKGPFNILPNKTKKVKNRSKVNNQSGF